MDFEEGEVDDISDCESDVVSPTLESRNLQSSPHTTKRVNVVSPRKNGHYSRNRKRSRDDSGHNPPNGSAFVDTLRDHAVSYYSEEEDFQVTDRERDRNVSDNRRKRKRKKERIVKHVSVEQCRFYMDGRCNKGDNCPYKHNFKPPKKQELCKFYSIGVCSKGNSCLFLHGEFPCKFFHVHGKCNQGESCKFSHAPLNNYSKQLLDRLLNAKDAVNSTADRIRDSGRSLLGPGVYATHNEHGDMDYRCGRTTVNHIAPQNMTSTQMDYGRNSPPHQPLFAPVFNQRPFLAEPIPRMPEIPNHPSYRSVINDQPLRPPFFPDNQFPGSSRPLGRLPFVPPRLDSPSFQRMVPPIQRLPPDLSLQPQPPHLGIPPPLSMFGDFATSPGLPRFRPQYGLPAQNPPPVSSGFDGIVHSTSEALVSSELDKMAALLASSKPPISSTGTSCDPRTQSPEQQTSTPRATPHNEECTTTPTTPGGIVRNTLILSSPEVVGSEAQQQAHQIPVNSSPVLWRLVKLDMNVKIPYPLMQLNLEGLPHRFDDPRLRGHLSAFRVQPQHVNSMVSMLGEQNPELLDKKEDEQCDITPDAIDVKATQSQQLDNFRTPTTENNTTVRRPVKLQLNEMANTFSISQQPVQPHSCTGDRSYLDDPRFRRRRIIATTVVGLPVVTSSGRGHQPVGDALQSHTRLGGSVVEPQGEIQQTSA